jgi:hypothetical protein
MNRVRFIRLVWYTMGNLGKAADYIRILNFCSERSKLWDEHFHTARANVLKCKIAWVTILAVFTESIRNLLKEDIVSDGLTRNRKKQKNWVFIVEDLTSGQLLEESPELTERIFAF